MKKWWKSRTIIVTILVSSLMLIDLFADFLPGKGAQYVTGAYTLVIFVLKMLDRKLFDRVVSGKAASDEFISKRAAKKTAESKEAGKEPNDA